MQVLGQKMFIFKKFFFKPEKDAWPLLNYGILACFVCVYSSIL